MMPKNLPQYILENWERYKVTISDASKSDVGVSLVESEEEIYNFDQVCKDFFAGKNVPTSADGVQIQGRNVELVEFKSGFKQRVTKDKFDPDKGTCKSAGKVCTDYWNLFWENQDRKRAQLISSVRTKAIESYVFLEKHILPRCLDYTEGGKMKLVFTVVIDEDGAVSGFITMEDLIEEITGNIYDEYDEKPTTITQISENVFEIDASLPIQDVNRALDLDIQVENDIYTTLAGYITYTLGDIPQVGIKIEFDDMIFTILEVINNRIIKVQIEKIIINDEDEE
jgi:hypothetical protein